MYNKYECKYDLYVEYQKEVQRRRSRFTINRNNRLEHIKLMKETFPGIRNILCVGARNVSEVDDIENAGFGAIGIDLFSESNKILILDMHKIGNYFLKDEFDVAYMSHSLEHSYDPKIVMNGIRNVCSTGVFVIVPMLTQPSRKEMVVFDFMKVNNPNIEQIIFDIKPIAGMVDVPWVTSDIYRKEIVFPLVWC